MLYFPDRTASRLFSVRRGYALFFEFISIKKLTEHNVRAVLRAMVERGVNHAAVIARNNLTQMFAWAEKRQLWRRLLVDGDPMDLVEKEKIVSPDYDMNNQSDRLLPPDEIGV